MRSGKASLMERVAAFIVDKRNIIFLIYIAAAVFCIFSSGWVEVSDSLTKYLPESTETQIGLELMDDEFTTFGTARIVVENVSYEQAEKICADIERVPGVKEVAFDDSPEHYNEAAALFSVTFDGENDDEVSVLAMDTLRDMLSVYDLYVNTEVGNPLKAIINRELLIVDGIAALIIVVVLLFTSKTYAEIPVLLITFGAAALLNMGTNYMMGEISFVTDSVAIVLQLAMAIDYAIILCNRYKEEHEKLPIREAVIVALSKAVPEICGSSLTTIGGLVAMLFMQFKLGPDMALCLIKSILFALLSAFVVMPGLLMLFGPLIDKTGHRSFVPKISFVGKFAYATRHVVPILFVALAVIGWRLSSDCPYAYGYGLISAPKLNETQIAENMIDDNFSTKNLMALVVPAGDYDKERAILDELEQYDEVDSTLGLSNVEAMGGYMLTDRLTPRQFSELTDLDYEVAEFLYGAYAANHENYGKIVGGLSTYSVPLIDMFLFLYDEVQQGYVTLDDELQSTLDDAYTQMTNAKLQLQSEQYSRMLIYSTLPVSGDETYAFTDTVTAIAQKYYPGEKVYLAGDSTNEYEFEKSFAVDNKVVSIVSILIVMAVLLFTFNSAGMPVLLILVIQGCIWINFSFPTITGKYLFFLGYLIVSSIQMGANIDYAIVIASRFQETKAKMHHRDAIIETLNFAFPTIITSGSILSISGFLIGRMTSEPVIAGIGESLGRGTVISIIMVMFALPQILLIGSKVIDRTSFAVPNVIHRHAADGRIRLDGVVHGEIHGTVSGVVRAIVDGDVNVTVISGSMVEEGGADDETE